MTQDSSLAPTVSQSYSGAQFGDDPLEVPVPLPWDSVYSLLLADRLVVLVTSERFGDTGGPCVELMETLPTHTKEIAMRGYKNCLLGAVCALAILSDGQVVLGQAAAPVVPLVPGLTIVLAAHDTAPAGAPKSTIAQKRRSGRL